MIIKSAPGSNKIFRLASQDFVEAPQIDFENVHTLPKRTVANNIHYKYRGNWSNGLYNHLHNISHLYPSLLTSDVHNRDNPIDLGDYQYDEGGYHNTLYPGLFRQTSPRLEALRPVIHSLSDLMARHILPHIPDNYIINDYLDEFPGRAKHLVPNIEEIENRDKAHALLTHVLNYATNAAYRRYGLHSRRWSGRYVISPHMLINYGRQYPVKDDILKTFTNTAMDQIRNRTTEPNAVHIHTYFPEDNTEIADNPYNYYQRSL